LPKKIYQKFVITKKCLFLQSDYFRKENFAEMKKDIHPKDYREVVFKDMSNDTHIITRSSIKTREKIELDGVTYPLIKIEISATSHPYYTGKTKFVDSAGRVDKFNKRYQKS